MHPAIAPDKIHVTSTAQPGLIEPCWYWLGSHDAGGHARVKHDGVNKHVRRLVVSQRYGRLRSDQHVIPLCRDPRCISPGHLIVVPAKEAREFGRYGRIGVGDLCMVKSMIRRGDITLAYAASVYAVAERTLSISMMACQDFD